MKLNIFKDPKAAIDSIAAYFIEEAKKSISEKGRFDVSLSGGSSPKKLYELLAQNYSGAIDWTKVYLFFGDERYVAHDHPDSNYLMATTALAPLNLSDEQIFKVDTSLDPESAALEYERCLKRHFGQDVAFDLVLLGLGDDAHTASLFPGTSVLFNDENLIKEVYLEDKQVYRITMTAPLINKAKNIAFLTFGEGKADAIKHVLEGEKDITKYPAQLIKPMNGEVQWFVDEAAVSKLSK
ncbi:6-phosphogluconolactonase [Pseudopedobacter saltans DSM 12145]|uniref:6-phosphogluconolactonase n=1 Tax=Pseudopedobacter saltans (strain ATCC 51119 / DSM 12145 / JCM 21818 / CCUG 39354 / LMG 10337 / NBRC 100064 / NCIMB 13643) TaxID=762903 RepID=F0S8C6_PSESL|nr:6-phosphogluconolactonase [Pseudopedobacter saltans]ADY53390.1 6-phosphogluconolactonase [Pseudopedobacter saltans DSM 12145]